MDLTGQLSNPWPRTREVARHHVPAGQVARRAARARSAPRQKQVRLSEEQQAELVARHKAGALQKELA